MWLAAAVCLLTAGGAAHASDLCRPLSAPEPDTEQVTASEGDTARLLCPLDARRAATTWAKLELPRARLLALGMPPELRHIEAGPGSARYRLGRAGRPREQWRLVISPVTLADAGLYRCYAMYERPEMANSGRLVRLTVLPAGGAARVLGPPQRAVPSGNPLTLNCAGRGPLHWRRDGQPPSAAAVITAGRHCSELTLVAVTAEDAGEYTCGSGAAGEASGGVRVNVLKVVVPVVEERERQSDASALHSCDLLVILALCCQCVIGMLTMN